MARSSVAIRAISKIAPGGHDHALFNSELRFLSNLDQMFCSTANNPQLVFYFKSQYTSPTEITSLMQSLKASLAMVLEDYPVVAGRVRVNNKGRLELVREAGDGVVFVEATTDARLEDWHDLRQCALLLELNHQAEDIMSTTKVEGTPLAKIQVTIFKCGGAALGFNFAHILTDGMGAIQFLKAWGEVHQRQRLSITPHLARTILKARDPPRLSVPITETASSVMLLPKEGTNSIAAAAALPSRNDPTTSPDLPPPCILLRLSEDKVKECVKEVERGPFAYGRATTHEALCALVWSSLTRARTRSSVDEETKFWFPVNIRSRLHPPLPEGYFGNAILQSVVVAKASAIATSHVSYAAKLIHESIQSHNAGFCQSAIDWTELQLRDGESLGLYFSDLQVFGCTTFVGFPVYEVNFGWGKPLYVSFLQIRPESDPGPRSGTLIMPSPDGGRSRDLAIRCSNQEHMDALLNDPLFQPYRDPQNDILI